MSSQEVKNVIIIGAGGNLGPTILRTFLNHSNFNVTVLSRQSSKSTFPDSVKVVRADFDSPDSLTEAFKGQDAVLSLIAGSALGDQNKLIDAAIAAGVKRFIPSDFGSDTTNEKVLSIVPIVNAKKAVVDYLKSKEDKISWSAVINGPFFDWGFRVGFLGVNPTAKTATLFDGGNAPFQVTNLRTIGLALVKLLEQPQLSKNQYIFISSFTVTQSELLSLAEKVSGEKYAVTHVTSEEVIKKGAEKLTKGDFSGIPDLLQGAAFGSHGLGDFRKAGLWNEKLGLEKEDLEESARTVLSGKLVGEE